MTTLVAPGQEKGGRIWGAWRVATTAAWVAVSVVAVLLVWRGFDGMGRDLKPMRRAASLALSGRPVYGVRDFVYPPSAAVASIPLTVFPLRIMEVLYFSVEVVVVVALAASSVRVLAPARPWRPFAMAALGAGLLGSLVSRHALGLENVSVLVAPVVLAMAWNFGRGRWFAGCVVLTTGLLVKPLLAPLVLVPFLARRSWAAVFALAGAALMTVACLPLAGGVGQMARVAARLSRGNVLVGGRSGNNLSLTGLGTYQDIPADVVTVLRLVIVLATMAVGVLVAVRGRIWDVGHVLMLSTLLLSAVFLTSNLSEVHFLFALVPGAVAIVLRSSSRVGAWTGALGLAALCAPFWWFTTSAEQILEVSAEMLLFVAAVAAVVSGLTTDPTIDGAGEDAALQVRRRADRRRPAVQRPRRGLGAARWGPAPRLAYTGKRSTREVLTFALVTLTRLSSACPGHLPARRPGG